MSNTNNKKSLFYRTTHHLSTIRRHRKEVRKNCFACGLYKQGLLHDLSKYSLAELKPSITYFTGNKSPYFAEKKDRGYSLGWLHHKGKNKHHWEYWYDMIDGKYTPIEMPYKYLVEMVCDRIAACKVYEGDAYTQRSAIDYLHKSHDSVYMHPNNLKQLEEILNEVAEYGEEATFKKLKQKIKDGNY